jgi:citrate lyase beta subunit
MEVPIRSRRALLYMPGDDMHKIQKAAVLGADCICMDLEDGVASNRKAQARRTVVDALGSLNFGSSERLVRINPVGSGLEGEDLQAALAGKPDGIVIPKVESSEQIRWVSERIASYEQAGGWPAGRVVIIAIVETARGIVNLQSIAGADQRLRALIFGAEDFVGDIWAVRTAEGREVFYARSAVVVHAAAAGLQAIDMVYVDFRDLEGLKAEAVQGNQMGFAGKQVIHPAQVVPVQEAFTPGDEEIQQARRLLDAYEQHQTAGQGAFALEGKMVDAPIVKAAERVVARARAAGKL